MANLIYSSIASLDGYIEDREGNFDWAVPSDDTHRFINDLQRPVGTHLYGRRTYEVMIGWETDPSIAEQSPQMRDFADLWQSAEKIVYSTTLEKPSTTRTRLERTFDPDSIRQMKATADRDILIGGPGLAAHAINAGLVDEVQVFVVPVLVGGGKPSFPDRGFRSQARAGRPARVSRWHGLPPVSTRGRNSLTLDRS